MTGHEYANLIASYIVRHFGPRGLKVYREVNVGKTVIGKNRRLDGTTDRGLIQEVTIAGSNRAGTVAQGLVNVRLNMDPPPQLGGTAGVEMCFQAPDVRNVVVQPPEYPV